MPEYSWTQIAVGVTLVALSAVHWWTSSRTVGGLLTVVGPATSGYDGNAEGSGS